MTLKADILTDIGTTFFNTDEFAVDATLNSVTAITGIFDNAFRLVNGVESYGPQILCASTDVSTAVQGSTVEIGGTTYFVSGIQPDGTGMTLLILSKE
jgi:hypothetical protein